MTDCEQVSLWQKTVLAPELRFWSMSRFTLALQLILSDQLSTTCTFGLWMSFLLVCYMPVTSWGWSQQYKDMMKSVQRQCFSAEPLQLVSLGRCWWYDRSRSMNNEPKLWKDRFRTAMIQLGRGGANVQQRWIQLFQETMKDLGEQEMKEVREIPGDPNFFDIFWGHQKRQLRWFEWQKLLQIMNFMNCHQILDLSVPWWTILNHVTGSMDVRELCARFVDGRTSSNPCLHGPPRWGLESELYIQKRSRVKHGETRKNLSFLRSFYGWSYLLSGTCQAGQTDPGETPGPAILPTKLDVLGCQFWIQKRRPAPGEPKAETRGVDCPAGL